MDIDDNSMILLYSDGLLEAFELFEIAKKDGSKKDIAAMKRADTVCMSA